MSLTEILEQVEKLSPADRAKVAEVLKHPENNQDLLSVKERQKEFNRRLLNEGMLKRIPTGNTAGLKFKSIKIKGKPLSETVIEERR